MKKRRVVWAVIALLAVGGVALLLPSSPLFYDRLFGAGDAQYDGRSVKSWARDLEHEDAATRVTAAKALGAFGPSAEEAAPSLGSRMLNDSDRIVRIEASLALS